MLVTSGPTSEPIDPVRFIANRSSGKQGHAIAAAAAAAGADVVLVSGPVNLPDPHGVARTRGLLLRSTKASAPRRFCTAKVTLTAVLALAVGLAEP